MGSGEMGGGQRRGRREGRRRCEGGDGRGRGGEMGGMGKEEIGEMEGGDGRGRGGEGERWEKDFEDCQ